MQRGRRLSDDLSTLLEKINNPNVSCDDEHRAIYLCDEINDDSAFKVINYLRKLAGSSEPIHLNLSSNGGCIYATMALIGMIRAIQATTPVHITALGWCMSAASVLLQAGTTRRATKDTTIMLHMGSEELAGNPDEVAKWKKHNDKMGKRMLEIYAERSNYTARQWKRKLNSEFIRTADECLELGLIDEVV